MSTLKIEKTVKKLLSDDKGYVIAIVVALFIVSYLLVSYYLVYRPIPEGFSNINLLDTDHKAVNYPETVVIGHNNTFSVYVNVENHMGKAEQYKILVKNAQSLEVLPINASAINTYEKTVADGEAWSTPTTVTLDQVGNYNVVFELYIYNPDTSTYQFDPYYLFAILNVKVTN
jgi:uncharacterized membrane protein